MIKIRIQGLPNEIAAFGEFLKVLPQITVNFKKQFVPLIRSGSKRQTLRRSRKRQTLASDILYLYTGMRTKQCELIGRYVCLSVDQVIIAENGDVVLNGNVLNCREAQALAQADGFDDLVDFIDFFTELYGIPVTLDLIKWTAKRK